MKYGKSSRNNKSRLFAGSAWLKRHYSRGGISAGIRTLRRWLVGFANN